MLWVKLYVEILDDPKMAAMPDHLFRTCVNLIAVAGRVEKKGRLGTTEEIGYWLRKDVPTMAAELAELEKCNVCVTRGNVWTLKNFRKRNSRAKSQTRQAVLDRVRKYRENKQKDDDVKRAGNADVTRYKSNGNAPRIEKNRIDKNLKHADVPSAPPPSEPPDPVKELCRVFEQASGITLPQPTTDKARKFVGSMWWNPLREMVNIANGSAPEILRAAIQHLRKDGITLANPNSALKTFTSKAGERAAPVKAERFIDY